MSNTTTAPRTHRIVPNYTGPRFFGVPVGDFSLFQTLILTVASGFVSFFIATFLAIMTMLVLTSMGRKPDFSIAYRWFGAPIGLFVLIAGGLYLGSLLVRRMRRQATAE